MWIKNVQCQQDVPLTIDFRKGINIAGKTFIGTFDWYRISWLSAGLLWYDPDRNIPITTVGEDNTFPIGGMGWVKTPEREFNRETMYKKLGTLQILPGNNGWLSIELFISASDIGRKVI